MPLYAPKTWLLALSIVGLAAPLPANGAPDSILNKKLLSTCTGDNSTTTFGYKAKPEMSIHEYDGAHNVFVLNQLNTRQIGDRRFAQASYVEIFFGKRSGNSYTKFYGDKASFDMNLRFVGKIAARRKPYWIVSKSYEDAARQPQGYLGISIYFRDATGSVPITLTCKSI